MKNIKQYSWLIFIFLATACYEPLEINTENIDQLEMPIKIAAPLMNGNLLIEYDSLINFDELGTGFITFIDNKAYIKYDTIVDFYDQLSVFLNATDLDFGNVTEFEQSFDMETDTTPTTYQVIGQIPNGNGGSKTIDSTISMMISDTFATRYDNANSIFLDTQNVNNIKIDGLDLDKVMNLGIDFEIYKVEIESGQINIKVSPDDIPFITDDSLRMTPSFRYQKDGLDTIISTNYYLPITNTNGQFPAGLEIKMNMALGNMFTTTNENFNQDFRLTSYDTIITIDLAGMYYEGNGDNMMGLKILNWMEINNPIKKAVVPLPKILDVNVSIENLKFQQVQFNYGKDSLMANNLDIPLDLFNILPDKFKIDGFTFKDPNLKLKLRSNLGFGAQLALNNMTFKTSTTPELITNSGDAILGIKQPLNPYSFTQKVIGLEDSLVIDSTTSRLSEIDIFKIKGLKLDYVLILNPEDNAGLPDKHNFIYLYDESMREEMYDVSLTAEAEIPIAFRFDDINYEVTEKMSFESLGIDSLLRLDENDSLNINVKLWTKNFPFDIATQFYFEETDNQGETEILDSMFLDEQIIIPSSVENKKDTAIWSLVVDANRYEKLQKMDSVRLKVHFAMDENDYFQVEKGNALEVGYKFSIGSSSATIIVE